jgi:phosphoribulokinase
MSVLLEGSDKQIELEEERTGARRMFIPGDLDPERGAALEEAIWEKMQFAQQLRTERLGEFTVGDEVHRSESLAIVQVLILYHLVTAKAAVAVSGDETSARTDRPAPEQPAATAAASNS